MCEEIEIADNTDSEGQLRLSHLASELSFDRSSGVCWERFSESLRVSLKPFLKDLKGFVSTSEGLEFLVIFTNAEQDLSIESFPAIREVIFSFEKLMEAQDPDGLSSELLGAYRWLKLVESTMKAEIARAVLVQNRRISMENIRSTAELLGINFSEFHSLIFWKDSPLT